MFYQGHANLIQFYVRLTFFLGGVGANFAIKIFILRALSVYQLVAAGDVS